MKIAVLAPVAWRTPPRKYGPWEQVASNIAEGLVAEGIDVTLFATGDSFTKGKLESIVIQGYEEDQNADPKVCECMHISNLMEQSHQFDLIHNHFDFLPLTYSRLIKTPIVTTIHGFSSPKIIEVYERYNDISSYISISYSDRSPRLNYLANVYHGIKQQDFTYQAVPDDYLLYFGRLHHHKGAYEAIQIAQKASMPLILSGFIQDRNYFREKIEPYLNDEIKYVGNSCPAKRNHLLGGAKALLHPINFDEPFGLSVVEAMFCGTPVIAFRRGSMPEIIVNQKTGFLVDNLDEAVEVTQDLESLNRADCHKWVKSKFTQKIMVKKYAAIFRRILEGKLEKISV